MEIPPGPEHAALGRSDRIDYRLVLEVRAAIVVGAILYAPCHALPAWLDFLYFPYPRLGLAIRALSVAAVWLLVYVTYFRVKQPRHLIWIELAAYVAVMAPVSWAAYIMPSTVLVGFLPSLVALAIFLPGRHVHHWMLCGACTVLTLLLVSRNCARPMSLPMGYVVSAMVQMAVISAGGSYLFGLMRREAARWHAQVESIEDMVRVGQELSSAGLLAPREVSDTIQAALDRGQGSRHDLVRDLLAEGKLTAFQAEQIASARTEALRIGPYLLLEPRGAGGMSEVFRVRNRESGEVAALKRMLQGRTESTELVTRFRHEAEMTAALDHPNIVRTIDVFDHEGTPCLVMEYVDGRSAAELLAERRSFTVAETLRIAEQVALASTTPTSAGSSTGTSSPGTS